MVSRRKRSLRGLGGTPEHHAVQSGINFDLALGEYKEAKELADKGKCSLSFRRILTARGSEGEAKAHMREAGSIQAFMDSWHGSTVEAAGDARTQAWRTFETKCLGTKGLSGTPRRRRRR